MLDWTWIIVAVIILVLLALMWIIGTRPAIEPSLPSEEYEPNDNNYYWMEHKLEFTPDNKVADPTPVEKPVEVKKPRKKKKKTFTKPKVRRIKRT